MKILRLVISIGLLWLAAACAAPTPAVTPEVKLGPPLPAPLQVLAAQRLKAVPDPRYPPADFGRAIALGDGVLAVGAPSITSGTEYGGPGSVYVYRRGTGGWTQEAQLKTSDQDDGFQFAQHFGAALALEGSILFAGAPAADDRQAGDNTGAVYIFQAGPDGWEETGILKSPQPAANAAFGNGLAVNGEHLAVLEGDLNQGSRLRLFQGGGKDWQQTALIEAKPPRGMRGGVATFDIVSDTLAVGTQFYQGEGAETRFSGQVLFYRFDGNTWAPSGSLPLDGFAGQIALGGSGSTPERMAIASHSQNGGWSSPVSIYRRSQAGWELEDSLQRPDMEFSSYLGSGFGGPVALSGDLLLVGAPGVSEDSFWDGAAYLYQWSGGRWVDQLRLVPTEDGGMGDFFGSAVEIYGNTLLISAPDEFGNAVYVYEVGAR